MALKRGLLYCLSSGWLALVAPNCQLALGGAQAEVEAEAEAEAEAEKKSKQQSIPGAPDCAVNGAPMMMAE